MDINYKDLSKVIAGLKQCAKENENRNTDTGAIRVSGICSDVANFLCKVQKDYKRWKESKENAGKMHVYIFAGEESGDIIADLFATSVPAVGEKMVLWDEGKYHHYNVTGRIYGANAVEKCGVWNIYVEPTERGFTD